MPAMIYLGWLVGILVASFTGVATLIVNSLTVPAVLAPIVTIISPIVAPFAPLLITILALVIVLVAYLVGYRSATLAIAPLLPPLVQGTISYPAGQQFFTASGSPTTVPATGGEYFGRGMLIGLTATLNFLPLSLIPVSGALLAPWAFTVISLGTTIAVARSRIYQGFLAWSAWLFPVSWIATGVGLLLFILNIPFAFTMFGAAAFRVDWTTGVILTAGGLPNLTSTLTQFSGAFSLGNFVFSDTVVAPADFTTPGTPPHETGHTLNTAMLGGIVLWINAIDENVFPKRLNLCFGELYAEGHSRAMPGAPIDDFSLRLWY